MPGETTEAAVEATAELVDDGLEVTLDFLGEDTLDSTQAEATVAAYLDVLKQLSARGPDPHAEVLGEAVAPSARRCPTTATRSRSRTPAPSAGPRATPAPR